MHCQQLAATSLACNDICGQPVRYVSYQHHAIHRCQFQKSTFATIMSHVQSLSSKGAPIVALHLVTPIGCTSQYREQITSLPQVTYSYRKSVQGASWIGGLARVGGEICLNLHDRGLHLALCASRQILVMLMYIMQTCLQNARQICAGGQKLSQMLSKCPPSICCRLPNHSVLLLL